MARQRQLRNETEVRELQVVYETCKNGPARTRLQAVRLYGSGYSAREIETITGAERRLLLRWYAKYRRGGPAALYDQRQGGNHPLAARSSLDRAIFLDGRDVIS